jgi:hypothetical protein
LKGCGKKQDTEEHSLVSEESKKGMGVQEGRKVYLGRFLQGCEALTIGKIS